MTLYRLMNGKPLTFTTEGKSEVEIAWGQIADQGEAGSGVIPIEAAIPAELLDMIEVSQYLNAKAGQGPKLRVSYREVVAESIHPTSDENEVHGPESEIFEVPVEGFQVPGARYDISGNWSGQVWVARFPLSAELSQSGHKLTGTCSWGSDTYRVDGKWNAKQDAWEVTLWVKEGKTEVPGLISLYLRTLPGDKLWLGVPPCVLRRAEVKEEKKGGWFSWFKW